MTVLIGPSTAPVTSIFGRTGAVVATLGDYNQSQIPAGVTLVTQSATPTVNTDPPNGAIFDITGLAQAVTSMTTNLSGTPIDGQVIWIRLTDNGTGRGITWGAKFAAPSVALPTTTVANKRLTVGLQWNTVTTTWDTLFVA